MEGKDSSRLILTRLDVPGVYQFRVTVSTVDGLGQGDGFVNVTVKPAPRVNHAPRAEIQPKEVTLQLPTNEAVLDGSSECFRIFFQRCHCLFLIRRHSSVNRMLCSWTYPFLLPISTELWPSFKLTLTFTLAKL